MHAQLEQAKLIIRSVLKRRWLVVMVAWPVALVSALLISVVPERFEASSRIYVDTQTVLKPLMAGLAYQPDIDQQVRMLARTVISRPNVERLVSNPTLGFAPADSMEREKLLTQLMNQIKVSAAGAGNLYSITYRDTSPERARQLVEATMDLFVNSGSGGKKRDSEDASKFIDVQIQSYEAKLVEAEARLKDFKVRNFGVSGVSNQDYFARMSALSDEVNKLKIDLNAAEQSRDAYRRELSAEEPSLPVDSQIVVIPGPIPEVDARLEAQKRQLDELLRRYTEEHPDVIAARRTIVQLEQQKRLDAEARARAAGNNKGKAAATSPVYQKIRMALAETEAQVASLRSQLSAQQARLEQIRALAGRVPQVEAELAQLNRDYDVIRRNYEQLVARRESASLGLKLDESSALAEFRVVEPPRVAPRPVFPGRLHLALLAVAVALGAGVGAAVLAGVLKPTFQDIKTLEGLTGRPVLGTVSMSISEGGARLARQDLMRFGLACGLLLVLQVTWVAWIAAGHSV